MPALSARAVISSGVTNMSSAIHQRGSPDDAIINMDDVDEVRHWTRLLRTTPERLREAVIRVGTSGENVKRYLERMRP
jgi:hypothetical protein